MDGQRSFVAELMHRRVPQILGLYVAGVWMSIEIGDWIAERFDLGPQLTAYLFVVLGVMLPSVALVAWNHGAPGKDQWRKTERALIPVNLLVAVGIAVMIARAPDARVQPAVAAVAPPTPPGVEAAADPEQQSSNTQRIIAFFWRTSLPDELAWIGYALPFAISEDVDRSSPAFKTMTPFDSEATRRVIERSGYPNLTGEPRAVQMRIAGDRQVRYFLRGDIEVAPEGGDSLVFNYAVHSTQTGQAVVEGTETGSAERLFEVADAVADQVRGFLVEQAGGNIAVTDLPVAESLTGSLDALQAYLRGRLVLSLAQDYSGAAESIDAAIEADPTFAEALAYRSILSFYQGDLAGARETIAEALKFADYKLSSSSKYQLQMNDATMRGDVQAARDIAVTWSEIEPMNEMAFMAIAEMTVLLNGNLDEALEAFRRVRELNEYAYDTWLGEAKVHTLRQDLDAAKSALATYVEARPDSVDAYISLARVQMAAREYDDAMETFRKAQVLDPNSLAPAIGQLQIQQRLGNFARAVDAIEQLKARAEGPQEQIKVLTLQMDLAFLRGRYRDGLAALEEIDRIAEASMPSLLRDLQVRLPAIATRVYLGDDSEALIDELETIGADLQPPWNGIVSFFKMQVYDVAGQEQQYIDALENVERFFSERPIPSMRPMLLSARAEVAILRGDEGSAAEQVDEAIGLLRSSFLQLEVTEDSFEIEAELYDQLRRAGEPQRAIDGLSNIVRAYPSLGLAHLRLAQAHYSNGDVEAARAALDAAADVWSEADEGFVYLRELSELREALTT